MTKCTPCACRVKLIFHPNPAHAEIIYCPLHAAAPQLAEALRELLVNHNAHPERCCSGCLAAVVQAEAALKAAGIEP